ncbi:LexA family protein [Chitinophaga nivalis]|uniref:S24 family peptidase n=1 Tax=Chitinophaga nivalis TaxID=2991709 RepID=A0ABT3IFK0_9BACT|nr:S24 family peptidase [Chitinophaga nivalis]MCW3467582.1 S24 family peptidase [Chitinophaga nivalis]MCW3482726.1 S24 family peptidase [Chitinophaga nivalis]
MEALKVSNTHIRLPVLSSPDEPELATDLSYMLHPSPGHTFVVRVKGDSMVEAHMPDGCMAVVDRSRRPATGDIIVALLDGDYTIKRLVKAGRHWVLHPENTFYKPIMITEETDFQVWGVVIAIIIDVCK